VPAHTHLQHSATADAWTSGTHVASASGRHVPERM
jgi:hypothetical protein